MDITTYEDLLARVEQGNGPKYLYFWGHRESGQGVTKACLSQWYPSRFSVGGTTYFSAEHYMMAEKARLFSDKEAENDILNAKTPGAVKAIGRQVRGFKEDVWQQNRFDIVVRGNVAKFSQNEALRGFLIGTGKRVLVEASPVDRIWGVGLAVDDERIHNPRSWKGKNLLGFALMRTRNELIK